MCNIIIINKNSSDIELNDYNDKRYLIKWDYEGSAHITSNGNKIKETAGCVYVLENLMGVTQIFIPYITDDDAQYETLNNIKWRSIYDKSIGKWLKIEGVHSDL